MILFPGLALFLAVLGINLAGDGLRDMLDPNWPDGPNNTAPALSAESHFPRFTTMLSGERKDRFGWLVRDIALYVEQESGDEDVVAWARIHVFFKGLAEVNSDAATQHVGGGLRLTMVVGRPEFVGQAGDLPRPGTLSPGGVAVDFRTALHLLAGERVAAIRRVYPGLGLYRRYVSPLTGSG